MTAIKSPAIFLVLQRSDAGTTTMIDRNILQGSIAISHNCPDSDFSVRVSLSKEDMKRAYANAQRAPTLNFYDHFVNEYSTADEFLPEGVAIFEGTINERWISVAIGTTDFNVGVEIVGSSIFDDPFDALDGTLPAPTELSLQDRLDVAHILRTLLH